MRSRLLAATLLVLLEAGCRLAPTTRPATTALLATVRAPGVELEVSCTDADSVELGRLSTGLIAAASSVALWGSFRSRLQVRVLEDHDALERAVGRPGYSWLRAWAYGDLVLLQSPRTWEATTQAQAPDVLELLTHELTHALMYQLLEPDDSPPSWSSGAALEEPPLWFREGMASVTAGQGKKRLSPEELRDWLLRHPGKNPLEPDGELVRTEKEAVYGAAHRAFELLLARGGDQAIRDVLRGMRSGARFSDAFAAATGQQASTFAAEALRQGFTAAVVDKHPEQGAGGP